MIASFHNHSDWSDGQTGVGAMYTSADRMRVDILGLSDHFCIYPDGSSPDWSISPDRADEYVDEVVSYQGKGLMEVIVGAEFDWFDNHGPILEPVVSALTLDYRIGSVHHVDGKQFDASPAFWQALSEEQRDEVFAKYWGLIRGLAESTMFDIAGHLDLPKKFGFKPKSDMGPVIDAALDAIAANDLVVELNTAGFGRPCADAYPSLDILKKCRAREIPVTLSADGHIPGHILFEFQRGLARLHEAGYSSVARFRGREAWFEPLDNALRSERE